MPVVGAGWPTGPCCRVTVVVGEVDVEVEVDIDVDDNDDVDDDVMATEVVVEED